jgi:hypothetical protein
MRVTVIATGLGDDRPRRRAPEAPVESRSNVMVLRREAPSASASAPAASAERAGPSEGQLERAGSQREPAREPRRRDDFVSPFEDELDVPTFIRRGGHAETDEDADEPAFLRRSAD